MNNERILVSDIDGTLLDGGEPTSGLGRLRKLLELKEHVRLVYATGRSFDSTWRLVDSKILLPVPDAIAALVGTEVWMPPWREMDCEFRKKVENGWNREAVLTATSGISALDLQPPEYQSYRKVSFYLEDRSVLNLVKDRLRSLGAKARMVFSGDRYLDILPKKSGKKNAIEHIRQLWKVAKPNLLVCGDSGNDLDMLDEPGFLAVAVGNSEDDLKVLQDSETVHFSKLPFAAGVLEGAEAYDFWSRSSSTHS